MARSRRKPSAETPLPTSKPDATIAPISSPDVFDEAVAAQQQPPSEATPTAVPATAGFTGRVTRPDPFGEMTIALSDNKDAPKMRFFRNQRFQQLAIQFDEKPDEGIRQKLRDDGWTWRPPEGMWTKQLGERAGETHRQGQELFASIGNEMRQAIGLEPVAISAQSR